MAMHGGQRGRLGLSDLPSVSDIRDRVSAHIDVFGQHKVCLQPSGIFEAEGERSQVQELQFWVGELVIIGCGKYLEIMGLVVRIEKACLRTMKGNVSQITFRRLAEQKVKGSSFRSR